MTSDFTGRTALVTGASSGLGAAVVRRLAGAGAHVHAASRDQERLAAVAAGCADLPGEVTVGHLDVASPASCRAAVAEAVDLSGRLDVLVNNAGRHDFRLTAEVTEEQWLLDVAVNLGGSFFCSQAAIPTCSRRAATSSTSPRWQGWSARPTRPPTPRPSTASSG